MPNKSAISLSIAIVCYHSDHTELKRLIASLVDAIGQLKKNQETKPVCLTLIDNSAPSNLTLAMFDSFQEQTKNVELKLKLISGQGNIGYGAAHNLALKDLESDYHLMLNPDVVLDKQSLTEGLGQLTKNQTTAMVSPTAINEYGDNQYLCKRYPSVLTLFVRGFLPPLLQSPFSKRLAHYEMRELYSGTTSDLRPASVPIISGCFMLCRTSALKAVKGFDERYFLYFEDFDLSLRIGQAGRISFAPSMKITHGGGNAAKKGLKHVRFFIITGIRFFNTHGWRWF